MTGWLGLTLALLLAPPSQASPDPRSVSLALARLPQNPTVEAVQTAALRQAGITPRVVRRWLHRARAAAILPSVVVEADMDWDRGLKLDQEPGMPDRLGNDLSHANRLRFRATWDLDRLIFSADELRAVRTGLDVMDWRRRLLLDVTQLYYERLRLLLENALVPPPSPSAAIDRLARVLEIEAILAGLTGLTFPKSNGPGGPTNKW